MSEPLKADLLEQALELEPAKRLDLANRLLDSVEGVEDEAWADAWAHELDRRVKAVEGGQDAGSSWADVRARALSELSTL